jgi:hypothetical protein
VARFNFSIFAGDKCWVAGVELTTANEPPARKPQIWGRRPSADDPSHPLRCNLLLNLANFLPYSNRIISGNRTNDGRDLIGEVREHPLQTNQSGTASAI